MTHCRVTYKTDLGNEHHVEVDAENLFEAVAYAVRSFRIFGYSIGPTCQFIVNVPSTGITGHLLSLKQVEDFATKASGPGEGMVISKILVRSLLGLALDSDVATGIPVTADEDRSHAGQQAMNTIVVERTATGYRALHMTNVKKADQEDRQISDELALEEYLESKGTPRHKVVKAMDDLSRLGKIVINFTS